MTPPMGRPKTVFLELPPRMTARTLKRGKVLYYYTGGAKKLALGSDLNKARMEWARLENGGAAPGTTSYLAVADRWEKEGIHKGTRGRQRSVKTQFDFTRALKNLRVSFKEFTLEEIKPMHIKQYLDRRTKKVTANREISVLSLIFNWAREKGVIDCPNPCFGVSRNEERPRERYITDEEYLEVWTKAAPELQDAMDLAYLTGQRASDVLKMSRKDIREGCLWVRQNKTGAKVGIRIEGQLKDVVERCRSRPRTVATMLLVAGVDGLKLTISALHHRFLAANPGNTWQFRDLRAKAATDAGNISHAQRLLGHSTETTTAAVYRRVKGNIVSPLK
jgi:integrase